MMKNKNLQTNEELEFIEFRTEGKKVYVNLYQSVIQAGFPSPADDFLEQQISLDERYLSHPDSTYLVRVKGNSMYPTLIEGDILIVRSDLIIQDNMIAIVSLNNAHFTVKRMDLKNKFLVPDNPKFKKIAITEEDQLRYLGRVVTIIRDL